MTNLKINQVLNNKDGKRRMQILDILPNTLIVWDGGSPYITRKSELENYGYIIPQEVK